MNAFLNILRKHEIKEGVLNRGKLTTLQVNMGDLCNQSCTHCHIGASPYGKKIMHRQIVNNILNFLSLHKIKTLDITGGAPELNPDFDYFIGKGRQLVDELIVRSNLTVFFEQGRKHLPYLFKENNVHLICSMPCYTRENVDNQRGNGVFEKSIKALQLLNKLGFSLQENLKLDLVYNSQGAYLPASQYRLEKDYRKVLSENYGIEFNHLLTITNMPINRFKKQLEKNNEYEKYSNILEVNFNPETLQTLMCRTFISVGFDGRLYDCDFNLALGLGLKDEMENFLTIDKLNIDELENRQIITGKHCLACTAGSGSSCQGALTNAYPSILRDEGDRKDNVKVYYGQVLQSKKDLKTNACCSAAEFSAQQKEIIKLIEDEILDKFYGCGSPIPDLLDGCTVLDLGCGTGRDAYIVSYLAGEEGKVIGLDMTDEQLEIAEKYKNIQMKKFGFKKSNVIFKKGYIEELKKAGIADNSVDVVISNCVINLSCDKSRVFSEIFRVLKPGGELYFSDVFSGRRVPGHIKDDPLLYGECLGGALYIEDFRRILREAGCLDYRVVSKRKITLNESEINEKAGMIDFYSMTIRAFKLNGLEDVCEDYGHIAVYSGTIPGNPHQFVLDNHHIFTTNKPVLVCGNTALMLSKTRYSGHFHVTGSFNEHFGRFTDCESKAKEDVDDSSGGCC